MPLSRKRYKILEIVALLIFLGLALWGLYEARKELDKITKKEQLVYVTDTAKRVRILREEGTEIYLSNTPWNVYYLEYNVDEAMEIFTDYLLTPERTAWFTIAKEVSHDTFTLFYNQYLLLIKYKTGYFGADDYIRAYIFYNTTDLPIAELAEADYKTLQDKCLDYIIYLPSSRVPTERFFRRIDRKIAKLSFS